MHDLDKHTRYLHSYVPNDYFWGIGIENETYLQFTKTIRRSPQFLYTRHGAERYSIDYFKGYAPEYKQLLKSLFPPTQDYEIPIFLNAHTLQKTDISGNHQTTFEKIPKPNKFYTGKTIHDILCEADPQTFLEKYKVNYTFDGDTIEFMSQNFYKTTTREVFQEYVKEKSSFLKAINKVFTEQRIFAQHGTLMYPPCNQSFVSFLTNMNNMATFNNGTYHLNFTMPTQLDVQGQPENRHQFVYKHKAAIRYIQYLEPLIIGLYGTADPFSTVSPKFSRASQRCAASRYIGIGTYDTDLMITGKLLQIPINELSVSKHEYWWYSVFHKTSNYVPLQKIGLDINFNKHGVHGIELRFLDWFPENRLHKLIKTIVYLLDYSLFYGLPDNPIHSPLWNQIVVKCLQSGPGTTLNDEEYGLYVTIFDIPITKKRVISEVWELIEKRLRQRPGICSKLMIKQPWFKGCI